ncbi:MAG: ribonuclease HII [Firmicutes bacterium]|nr:ribonuclease HII [Bacillota bacterium]
MEMTKEERIQKQRDRLIEMMEREQELRRQGCTHVAGVDEVGRGPLAGPVVAAAVVLPEDFDVLGVDDSKKLSEKKREELFDLISAKAVGVGIGMASEKEIDEVNILQATKLAMRRALAELGENMGEEPDYVLFDAMKIEEVTIPQESIIKGDAKCTCIAAASIIAKVTRDRMMVEYASAYPGYAFEKNKGYGTREHYSGLREFGACSIHRKTFLKKLH